MKAPEIFKHDMIFKKSSFSCPFNTSPLINVLLDKKGWWGERSNKTPSFHWAWQVSLLTASVQSQVSHTELLWMHLKLHANKLAGLASTSLLLVSPHVLKLFFFVWPMLLPNNRIQDCKEQDHRELESKRHLSTWVKIAVRVFFLPWLEVLQVHA